MSTTSTSVVDQAVITPETRTGLDPWVRAELPPPPMPRGLSWLGVVGPGVIVLGISIGSGEFLLGPAAFVRHGLSLLWVTAVAVFFLFAGRLAEPQDTDTVYLIGAGTFLLCVFILVLGKRIARTLELLNWVLVLCILGSFLVLALIYVPADRWLAALTGFAGYDAANRRFDFMPEGVDFFLIGALVAYSGCGGVLNITLSNWARDKGYGMGQHAGYIPSAVGGARINLAHHGFAFEPSAESLRRWHGWWRIVRADQWGVFFTGALLGMALPALLYVTFLPRGTDIVGLGISAALAQGVGAVAGPVLAGVIAVLGGWLLFKTQLDTVEAIMRTVTDILWTGSGRVRRWRGGDVRLVYYGVLAIVVVWGIIALRLAQPIVLLQISANVGGVVFVVASLHLLYLNTRLLPSELRPSMWRRVTLVLMALFYGLFATLSFASLF